MLGHLCIVEPGIVDMVLVLSVMQYGWTWYCWSLFHW